MKKRLLPLLLVALLLAGILPMGSVLAADGEKLIVAYLIFGNVPADISKVSGKITGITREKLGFEVELMPLAVGAYAQQMTLMLSGNEKLDLLVVLGNQFANYYNNDQLVELDDLLKEHGQGILKSIDAKYLNAGKINGVQYAVTTNRDLASGRGNFMMRKDILDKYGIDVSKIKTLADVEAVFDLVHEKEPELTVVTPGLANTSFLNWINSFDMLSNSFGVLENYGEKLEVVNMFETEEYKNYLTTMRRWYEKGFFSPDVTTATDVATVVIKAGAGFAYTSTYKPGLESQEASLCATEMVAVQVMDSLASTSAVQIVQWAIPYNATNPETSMKFMNLMYSDPEIANLLTFGIEGEHYVIHDDGRIGFPEGVTAENSTYNPSVGWEMGNQFLSHVWENSEPDIWDQMKEFNAGAKTSAAMGFSFDNTSVSTEVAAVQAAYDEYRMSLECGVVDPEGTLPTMLEKLNAAGLQRIIEEKQRQLDAWAAANGK